MILGAGVRSHGVNCVDLNPRFDAEIGCPDPWTGERLRRIIEMDEHALKRHGLAHRLVWSSCWSATERARSIAA